MLRGRDPLGWKDWPDISLLEWRYLGRVINQASKDIVVFPFKINSHFVKIPTDGESQSSSLTVFTPSLLTPVQITTFSYFIRGRISEVDSDDIDVGAVEEYLRLMQIARLQFPAKFEEDEPSKMYIAPFIKEIQFQQMYLLSGREGYRLVRSTGETILKALIGYLFRWEQIIGNPFWEVLRRGVRRANYPLLFSLRQDLFKESLEFMFGSKYDRHWNMLKAKGIIALDQISVHGAIINKPGVYPHVLINPFPQGLEQ